MTLSANANVNRFVDQDIREFPVGAAVHIYGNALVGVDPAGHLKAFEPGDLFVGLAYEEADNSSGVAAAIECRVFVQGDLEFALTSVAVKDVGRAVYATADDTIALAGHPDAYVGRVLGYQSAHLATIRLKTPGEKPLPSDGGHLEIVHDFVEPLTPTGNDGGGTLNYDNGLTLVSALGLGVLNVAGANGGADLQFDAVAEIGQASIETPEIFEASGGVTFEARLHMSDHGDAAALDVDWGLVDGITGDSRASMDHAAATDLALYHMDGSSDDIYCQSDDATTDVAPVDSTIDNVETAGSYKDCKIVVRTSGGVEFWVDGARVLAATTFAVRPAAVLGGIINLEKTSDDTTAVARIDRLRVAGAKT